MVLGFMVGILAPSGGLGVHLSRRETGASILVGIPVGYDHCRLGSVAEAVANNYYSAVGGGVWFGLFSLLAWWYGEAPSCRW